MITHAFIYLCLFDIPYFLSFLAILPKILFSYITYFQLLISEHNSNSCQSPTPLDVRVSTQVVCYNFGHITEITISYITYLQLLMSEHNSTCCQSPAPLDVRASCKCSKRHSISHPLNKILCQSWLLSTLCSIQWHIHLFS